MSRHLNKTYSVALPMALFVLILAGCRTADQNTAYSNKAAELAILCLSGDDYASFMDLMTEDAKSDEDKIYETFMLSQYLVGSRISFYLNNEVRTVFNWANDEAILNAFIRLPKHSQELVGASLLDNHFGPSITDDYSSRYYEMDGIPHPNTWRYIFTKFHNESVMNRYHEYMEKKRIDPRCTILSAPWQFQHADGSTHEGEWQYIYNQKKNEFDDVYLLPWHDYTQKTKATGKLTAWYQGKEQRFVELEFTDGKEHGKWKKWRMDGSMYGTGQSTQGLSVGASTFYDKDGAVTETRDYDKTERIHP